MKINEKINEKRNENSKGRNTIKDYLNLFWRKEKLRIFMKYCIVGINGIGINVAVLYFFTNVLGIFYVLSSLIAHETSIVANYILNDMWTFKGIGEKRSFMNKLIRYNLAKLSGVTLSIILLYLYTELFSTNYLISNVLAIGTGAIWGFFTSLRYVWK